ncbi:hypothetical protein SAMN05421736_114110 [Evansella caseinilytica]|uniref:Lipoprotein n=1 Tax=Evansella caseinilytica TaxID=1503961 RepID=A0A1H3TG76_9BACI|nr:DUF6612 family protein [Evansella caseinilytica]SDZ49292.1 hypothetical protein SAMN05421736_114110 [Evansella caseinilytica]
MKKILLPFLAAASLLFMAACSSENASGDDLSVEEILNESIKAMENLTSYSTVIETKQNMSGADNENYAIDANIEMDLAIDPLAFSQKTTMDLGELGDEMSYSAYFSEEQGYFMEDPMSGGWLKFPDELFGDLVNLSDAQLSPEEQLLPFKDYISELSVAAEGDYYIIKLKGDGADMEALADLVSGLAGEGMTESLAGVTINELEYEIKIDSETYYQKEATIFMDMSMSVMGEEVNIKQDIHLVLSNFNDMDDITIPQDVIDNAVELDDADLFGDF